MRIREIRQIMRDYKLKLDDTLDVWKFKDVIGKSVKPIDARHMASTETLTIDNGRQPGIKLRAILYHVPILE